MCLSRRAFGAPTVGHVTLGTLKHRNVEKWKRKGGGGARCGVGREGWIGRVGLGIGITKHHDHPA